MKSTVHRLTLQLLLLFACYTISRCVFAAMNAGHFAGLDAGEFCWILLNGLRFDAAAILTINAAYIALMLLPLPVWKSPPYVKALQVVFVAVNATALLFELADWAYFPYNFKRATSDVLNMIGRKGDFWNLLPTFFHDYWAVPLAWGGLLAGIIWANRRIVCRTPLSPSMRWTARLAVQQMVVLVAAAGIVVVGIRGGLQQIPIAIRNAVTVTDSRYAPLVLNTPFSIITSYQTPGLEEVHYLPDSVVPQYVHTAKRYANRPLRKRNVVLIIVESLSKEFTQMGPGPSYTPFIDSLMGESLVCTQAYANGLRSAEGLPCIIAGLPSLMHDPYTTSVYGTNKITALPSVLKGIGYNSAFYHGGTNGTMSLDVFAAAAGFDAYFGRHEYANDEEYDGSWGIPDEPFLKYAATGIGKLQQPFFASVFTLSSHPPYKVPKAWQQRLPAGTLPIHRAIAYADASLRGFFTAAATQPWFGNTLFVITADHCSPQNGGGFYGGGAGAYAIPMLYYAPGDSSLRGTFTGLTQQLDILPSVLDYLGYGNPFYAFGNSIFSAPAGKRFVVAAENESYQWLMDDYLLQTAGISVKGFYRYPADSLLQQNLQGQALPAQDTAQRYLEAFIQQYRQDLIRNRMKVE